MRYLLSLALILTATLAQAQGWRVQNDRAISPPSASGTPTGGPRVGGLELLCFEGRYIAYLFSPISPLGEEGPATIMVDGRPFPTRYTVPYDSPGLIVPPEAIQAMKAGRVLRITFPTGGQPYDASFNLAGSASAIGAIDAGCGRPTPATTPARYASATQQPNPEAQAIAQQLFAGGIAQARATDPRVGIDHAALIQHPSGTRILLTIVGPSTALFGISGFEEVIAVQRPGQAWEVVMSFSGTASYVDMGPAPSGYPDFMIQSVRGLNPPFGHWRWNGQVYAIAGRYP